MEYKKKIKNIIYNNLNNKIIDMLKLFNIKIKYYDIGASGGLQPRADNFVEVLNPIFIEPDTSEFSELEEKGYNAINCALWSEEKEKTFRITKSQRCSSIYEPNYEFLKKYKDPERFQIKEEIKMNCNTLDNIIEKDTESYFMKLDTQGSEYEILKGGKNVINNSIGFEIEIEFKEMYLNQPLFSEVNQFLLSNNFILLDFLNLCKWERDNHRNFGEIIFGDVLYLKSPEYILENTDLSNEEDYANLIRYVIILAMYKRLDLLKYLKNNLTNDYKIVNCIEDIVKILDKRFKLLKYVQNSFVDRIFRFIINDSKSSLLY